MANYGYDKHTSSKPIMSTFDGSPVVVGRYNEESRSFLNIVKASDRFRTHDAYGFDEPAVEELKKWDCLEIELQITGGNRYRIDFQTFLKQARRIDWPKRGETRFPARLYVPMNFWQVVQDEPAMPAVMEEPSGMDDGNQEGLPKVEEPVLGTLFDENSLRAVNLLVIGWQKIGGQINGYPRHFRATIHCDECSTRFESEVPCFDPCPKCGAPTGQMHCCCIDVLPIAPKREYAVRRELLVVDSQEGQEEIEILEILAASPAKQGVAA